MDHKFNTITGAVTESPRQGQDGREGEEQEQIDFKMVTFSLGGKDYAIDIMKVKEIAKFTHFTYVPNTLPYVRGVYNLRGEIISIIDLRGMFNLPAEKPQDGRPEDGLILRLDDNTLGVVVDRINRVVGISSTSIQPPHPIFADINLNYISGVAEFDGRLYIILDVESIFSKDGRSATGVEGSPPLGRAMREGVPSAPAAAGADSGPSGGAAGTAAGAPELPGGISGRSAVESGSATAGGTGGSAAPAREGGAGAAAAESGDVTFEFIAEGLATFKVMYVSDVNRRWVQERFKEWKKERSAQGADVQLQSEEEARAFVSPFYSAYTARFWGKDYADKVDTALPEISGNLVHAWNPGCGKGFETYCFAVILKRHYPGKQIKVWASDSDLLSISTAPNLVFPIDEVPGYCRDYVVQGTNEY
ncbi:MAG: chemotaxis protein CheW, partial [Spirochaetota bacterium]